MSFQLGPACLSTLHQGGDEIFILGDTETLDRVLSNVRGLDQMIFRGLCQFKLLF